MMKFGKKLLVFFALLMVLAFSAAPQLLAGDEIIPPSSPVQEAGDEIIPPSSASVVNISLY